MAQIAPDFMIRRSVFVFLLFSIPAGATIEHMTRCRLALLMLLAVAGALPAGEPTLKDLFPADGSVADAATIEKVLASLGGDVQAVRKAVAADAHYPPHKPGWQHVKYTAVAGSECRGTSPPCKPSTTNVPASRSVRRSWFSP